MSRRTASQAAAPPPDPLFECAGVTSEQLNTVLQLVQHSDITSLDVTIGTTRLSLRRTASTPASASEKPASTALEPSSLAITSPLVGVFRPSVKPGDGVMPGQSIGAVEALGMPTSVDAPQSGTVEELLVQDGSAVEYGQPLLIVRRGP